jgi:hypothetical protein
MQPKPQSLQLHTSMFRANVLTHTMTLIVCRAAVTPL